MDNKGFTLVELLVAAFLLVTLVSLLAVILEPAGTNWHAAAGKTDALQHGRIAMEEIVHELTYACRVISDPSAGRLTYYKKSNGRLMKYRIYKSGSSLLLALPEGAAVPIAGCIADFACYPAGELAAGEMLTICLKTAEKGQTCSFQSGVLVRNITEDIP